MKRQNERETEPRDKHTEAQRNTQIKRQQRPGEADMNKSLDIRRQRNKGIGDRDEENSDTDRAHRNTDEQTNRETQTHQRKRGG